MDADGGIAISVMKERGQVVAVPVTTFTGFICETFHFRDTSSRLPHPVLPAPKAARALPALSLLLLLRLLRAIKIEQDQFGLQQVAQRLRFTERARFSPQAVLGQRR